MAMWWCISACFLVAILTSRGHAAAVSSVQNEEIVSPLRVAQCRAQCLQRFAEAKDRTGSSCLQGPDCFMCWENCALLQSNYPVWGAMCAEKRICFPGCQQACRFHRETAPQLQSEPVIRTRGDEVLVIVPLSQGGGVARWKPAPAPRQRPRQRYVVYVLMVRSPGACTWRQISQTVDCEVRLEPGSPVLSPGTTVRVLVVDAEGLVTIYSPVPTTPPPTSSTSPAPAESTTAPPPQLSSVATPTKNEEPESWHLREVSLLHQRVLVIAEVTWTPRARRGVYLVTWEVDGGGLRGNLYTDSTHVTLSLWPDTIFHIQVQLVSRSDGQSRPTVERSETLLIDTRKAPQVQAGPAETSSPVVEPWQQHDPLTVHNERISRELLAGTGAAILLFLIVGAAAAWLCLRHNSTACCLSRSISCCFYSHKRRSLLADDSISADATQPSIVSVLTPKDCQQPEHCASLSWPETPELPPATRHEPRV